MGHNVVGAALVPAPSGTVGAALVVALGTHEGCPTIHVAIEYRAKMNFASDNTAPVAPAILDAIAAPVLGDARAPTGAVGLFDRCYWRDWG
jgi:hypothetical protein